MFFNAIALSNSESDILISTLHLTRKQYYARLSALLKVGLVKREMAKYYLTTSGMILYHGDVVSNNKWNERFYGFTGVFSGQPVKGDYSYVATGYGDPTASLFLDYTYHHHVSSTLNIINPNHMEKSITSDDPTSKWINVKSYYQIPTGLHLHRGDIIHLSRIVVVKTLVPITTGGNLTSDSNKSASVEAMNEKSYREGYQIATDNLTGLITVPPSGSSWYDSPNICDTQDGCPHSDDALSLIGTL